MASNGINRENNHRDFFDAKRIRVRGTRFDNAPVMFNPGNRLTVDGQQMDTSHIHQEDLSTIGRTNPPRTITS
ncbi:hypothetical protein [uncultured Leclercia sp.]|uniref:hypothetical protein n=1 Tax=uncultured Leclercia sp. TaxID=332959 RepID=UPI00259515F8|nr:hypothetical protein [uncultured Leclercia sp.]